MLRPSSGFDLALDVGTAATRVHVARRLTPLVRSSTVWRPGGARPALRGGVVVDTEAAATVLRELLRAVIDGARRIAGARAPLPLGH